MIVWRRLILSIDNVLLPHDNASQHTSITTRQTITLFGWTTLPHPPYSPNLMFQTIIFTPMKKGLKSQHHASAEIVKTAVMKWLKEQSTEFHKAGIHALIRRWNTAIEGNGDYVEKYGCDSQRTSFILMYDTCSCVSNSCKRHYFLIHPHMYIISCSF